jgi:hypothetical protein
LIKRNHFRGHGRFYSLVIGDARTGERVPISL